MKTLADRFASHVDVNGPTPIACPELGPCHIWTGARMKPGHGRLQYGAFKLGGRKVLAHRVAFELAYGPLPEGKSVLHACDNPACQAPRHLSAGTLSENMKQAYARGRRTKRAA